MNQRLLIGIIILAGIGSIGSVVAYTGTITANQGSFNNLLVTGTCTGCGAGEGSFTNYNTILLNTTLGLASPDSQIFNVFVSNTGNVTFAGLTNNVFITSTGSVLFKHGASVTSGGSATSQSETGKYAIIINNDATPIITVFKNGVQLQNLGINMAQFNTPFGGSALGISISPNGKYIAVICEASSTTDDRLLILQGS